jgi:hypothetical protein
MGKKKEPIIGTLTEVYRTAQKKLPPAPGYLATSSANRGLTSDEIVRRLQLPSKRTQAVGDFMQATGLSLFKCGRVLNEAMDAVTEEGSPDHRCRTKAAEVTLKIAGLIGSVNDPAKFAALNSGPNQPQIKISFSFGEGTKMTMTAGEESEAIDITPTEESDGQPE